MERSLLTIVVLLLWNGNALAVTTKLAVDYNDGEYSLLMLFQVRGSYETVLDRLTDFDNLHKISPAIQSSKLLGITAEGVNLVRTVVRGCVLFFCKTMKRVEEVVIEEEGRIHANVIPERSDFGFGHSQWQVKAETGLVNIQYQARMVPKFSVPPGIGPMLIKHIMRRELRQMAESLQQAE